LNITNIKSTYGYVGFLPFAVFSLTPWILGGEIGKTMILFQLAYGAIIITFLGGFAWGWRDNQKKDDDYKKFRTILTMLVCVSFLISSSYWINPYSNPYII
jgi:hypothetical protein